MKEILYRLFEHQYLGKEEARRILQGIAQGCYRIPHEEHLCRGVGGIP